MIHDLEIPRTLGHNLQINTKIIGFTSSLVTRLKKLKVKCSRFRLRHHYLLDRLILHFLADLHKGSMVKLLDRGPFHSTCCGCLKS